MTQTITVNRTDASAPSHQVSPEVTSNVSLRAVGPGGPGRVANGGGAGACARGTFTIPAGTWLNCLVGHGLDDDDASFIVDQDTAGDLVNLVAAPGLTAGTGGQTAGCTVSGSALVAASDVKHKGGNGHASGGGGSSGCATADGNNAAGSSGAASAGTGSGAGGNAGVAGSSPGGGGGGGASHADNAPGEIFIQYDIFTGLIYSYGCQDDAGNGTVADSSSLNRPAATSGGTTSHAMTVAGPGGTLTKAFDGTVLNSNSSDYIQLPHNFTIHDGGEGGIGFFAKRTGGAGDICILSSDETGHVYLTGTSVLFLGDIDNTTAAHGVNESNWHHYFIAAKTNETIELFVDGVSVGNFDAAHGEFAAFSIGRNAADAQPFLGYFCGVKLYNALPSNGQILTDAQEGGLGNSPAGGLARSGSNRSIRTISRM